MFKSFIGAAAVVCSSVATAAATKGVVVYDRGCGSRLIVETSMGYVLAEWFGGSVPYEGDTLIGELESYGMKEIYILNRKSDTRLWIEDYMLSRSRVVEKLTNKCG